MFRYSTFQVALKIYLLRKCRDQYICILYRYRIYFGSKLLPTPRWLLHSCAIIKAGVVWKQYAATYSYIFGHGWSLASGYHWHQIMRIGTEIAVWMPIINITAEAHECRYSLDRDCTCDDEVADYVMLTKLFWMGRHGHTRKYSNPSKEKMCQIFHSNCAIFWEWANTNYTKPLPQIGSDFALSTSSSSIYTI